jgi:hypothetical protein
LHQYWLAQIRITLTNVRSCSLPEQTPLSPSWSRLVVVNDHLGTRRRLRKKRSFRPSAASCSLGSNRPFAAGCLNGSSGPFLLLTQKGQRPGRSAKLPVTALELNGYFFTTLRARGGHVAINSKRRCRNTKYNLVPIGFINRNAHDAVRDNAIKR